MFLLFIGKLFSLLLADSSIRVNGNVYTARIMCFTLSGPFRVLWKGVLLLYWNDAIFYSKVFLLSLVLAFFNLNLLLKCTFEAYRISKTWHHFFFYSKSSNGTNTTNFDSCVMCGLNGLGSICICTYSSAYRICTDQQKSEIIISIFELMARTSCITSNDKLYDDTDERTTACNF